MAAEDVVVDDDGDVIELPPVQRSRERERERCDADRAARHAEGVQRRARHVFKRQSRWMVRELQDAEVLREFLRLVQADD